ncbi:CarboxypepD_reg-like domain-containing protein [Lutibacter oricola]|uniref:CarboxypepD_reg-like domain-containing protein n=1 Tax=Lutibacter oricola TaxID=762486 RepID=A0A1H3FNI8_9FLAO|nr:carboxypeptidase-like regulatory domain-containing protein [Lutibacter oricola]SDX92566.1 CarboxypepD_reg-like domain-containing protein [Lutibacter oricola]
MYRKRSLKFLVLSLGVITFMFTLTVTAQQKKIEVKGTIFDETNITLPYVAVSIIEKSIGTSSTEDGEFSIQITKNELQDSLTVSSLGFNPYKIKVQDYLNQSEQKIVLKQSVVKMTEVVILKPAEIVQNAIKKLKENTLSTSHKLEILYRRAATEGGKSKFFVENYIKIRDRGPAYGLGTVEIAEARKSADYRIWKRTQWTHSINYMASGNPLRPSDKKPNLKKYKWKKIGDSSYDGEDVVIVKGTPEKGWGFITFYIGLDNYGIYRIESGKSLYVYKKHKSGKLHLNYHSKEWGFGRSMIPKQYWNTEAEKMTYRLEAFVLNVETDKKKIKVRNYGGQTDMGSIDLEYHEDFWKNLSMPPDTKFFKRIKSELEGWYGVPLERQFELVNK